MSSKNTLLVVLSENMRAIRKAHGITQPQVVANAAAAGHLIRQPTVSRVERRVMVPSLDVLEALAAGLDIAPWQLLVRNLDPNNPPVLREVSPEEAKLWLRLADTAKRLGIK